ncbi:MAG: MMPL family transporter [Spirochaetales bacterium]|nr:MMPL family transporter [Spirochaetales bacterium]
MNITDSPSNRFLLSVLKNPVIAAAILAAAIVFSLLQIRGLNISVDMEDFFVSSDPILKNNEEFEKLFRNSDFIGVLVESADVFDRKTLELIHRTGSILKNEVPLAGKLISLTELEDLPLNGKSFNFDGPKLLSSDPEITEIEDLYKSIPSIGGTLFSLDNKEAWIILQLSPYTEEWDQFSVGRKAYEIISAIDPGNATLTGTGIPVYSYRKQTEMISDLMRVLIMGCLVALLLSSIIIRSPRGVAGAILIIILSLLVVFGIQGFWHITIDSAFISVPILLTMGVSIGYTVHFTRFFRIYFRKTGKRDESVLYAVQESGKPILFTALTTIVALLSFFFVEIRPIQWVGLTSALSIAAVCALTLIYYPLLLSLGKDQDPEITRSETDRIEPVLSKIPGFLEKRKKPIVLLFVLSLIISIFGLMKLEVDFNGVKMMGNRLSHMKDHLRISRSDIATGETLELVIKLNPDQFKTSDNLHNLKNIEDELMKSPLVKDTYSLAEAVMEFNYLRYNRNWDKYNIPEKDSLVRGLLLYYERIAPELINPWIDTEYKTARIFVELKDFSSMEIEKLLENTGKLIKENFSDEVTFYMSGSSYQMAIMNQYITRGLVRTVLIATAMIALLLIILFRSVKLGLVAMIPNIYPLIICGAVMGFAGIPMEFVTMTIAPMVMGLAVDDTIHFISHIRKDMLITGNPQMSIGFAYRTVGTAITETTIILCMTFLVFLVSDVNSIRNMGILSATGMAAAYGADIFITPLLISYFYGKKEKILPSQSRKQRNTQFTYLDIKKIIINFITPRKD